MVELETLKDFMTFPRIKDNGKATLLIDIFDLKQEAIKRIKLYRQDALIDGKWDSEFLSGASNELQSFLNITEEDLEPLANPWVDRNIQCEEQRH